MKIRFSTIADADVIVKLSKMVHEESWSNAFQFNEVKLRKAIDFYVMPQEKNAI